MIDVKNYASPVEVASGKGQIYTPVQSAARQMLLSILMLIASMPRRVISCHALPGHEPSFQARQVHARKAQTKSTPADKPLNPTKLFASIWVLTHVSLLVGGQ